MNPSFKLLLVLIIALEVSFTRHLTINLVLVAVAIIYLLTKRIRPRLFGWLFLMPLFPAVAVFITIAWFSPGHDYFYAWVLFSRIYVYVFTGAAITQTTSPLELTRSLEQNLHLPSKFAYGTLAAVNLIPRIKMAVKRFARLVKCGASICLGGHQRFISRQSCMPSPGRTNWRRLWNHTATLRIARGPAFIRLH